jgi:hypothetical protein
MTKTSKNEGDLLQRFMSIEFIDFIEVDAMLSTMDKYSDKLDYLSEVKEKHYDKFDRVASLMNHQEEAYYLSNFNSIISLIFSHWPLQTPLRIPSFLFDSHFKNYSTDISFSSWFIDFNARTYCFNYWKEQFEDNLVTKRRLKLIRDELKKIFQFEYEANRLFEEGKIKLHSNKLGSKKNPDQLIDEVEYLRTDEGYYNNHLFEGNVLDPYNRTSMILGKHHYYKNYLNEQRLAYNNEVIEDTNEYRFSFLFESNDLYEKAIKRLVENGFIERTNGRLKWVFPSTREFRTKQSIIALCVVLETEQYLRKDIEAVYRNIENEFGIKINKGNYSRSSNGFKEDYDNINTKNFSYTSMFKEIL